MTNHSKLPPSSAARRMTCPGSRELEERFGRKEESEASKEGTLAHEIAAIYLNGRCVDFSIGHKTLTQEMIDGADFYQRTVSRIFPNVSELITDGTFAIEKKLTMPNIHDEMWGTPDAWGVTEEGALHVFDYKFGFTPVDSYENWQLLAYACGVVRHEDLNITNVYLHIIQPRDYVSVSRHKVWNLSIAELESYRQRLITSEAQAMTANAPLRVSEQCKYCSARHACPSLQQAAFGAAEVSYRNVSNELTPEQVGNELKFLCEAKDVLDYRISALETEAQHYLQKGKVVNHFELKPVDGRLSWKINNKEIISIGLLHGVDLRKEATLTPTQAIEAGVPEEEIAKNAERKVSLKLSKIDVNQIKKLFKQKSL